MADRYTTLDLKQLQEEARRRGTSIRAKNSEQLRTDLRQADATALIPPPVGTMTPPATAPTPVTPRPVAPRPVAPTPATTTDPAVVSALNSLSQKLDSVVQDVQQLKANPPAPTPPAAPGSTTTTTSGTTTTTTVTKKTWQQKLDEFMKKYW